MCCIKYQILFLTFIIILVTAKKKDTIIINEGYGHPIPIPVPVPVMVHAGFHKSFGVHKGIGGLLGLASNDYPYPMNEFDQSYEQSLLQQKWMAQQGSRMTDYNTVAAGGESEKHYLKSPIDSYDLLPAENVPHFVFHPLPTNQPMNWPPMHPAQQMQQA